MTADLPIQLMGGRTRQAGGRPGAKAAEDGGRRPRSAGRGKEDERAGRKTTTATGEMGGHAGQGKGGPAVATDLPIRPMGGRAD